MDAGTRHVGDIGRILKSVQDDLKNLRNNIGGDAGGQQMQHLQSVIDRAESDIRAKAEAVLTTALSDQFTTLPRIRGADARTNTPSSLRRPQSAHREFTQRLTAKETLDRAKRAELVAKPTSKDARAFLEERFGVKAPPPPKVRVTMKPKGKLALYKTAPSAGALPALNRRDPTAPPPSITSKDVERGIYDLVNRGMIPGHVDLTPAFIQAPAPVLCGQVQLHPWDDQFMKQEPMTLGAFNVSAVKMDLISRAELPATRERERLRDSEVMRLDSAPTLKTQTIEAPMGTTKQPPAEEPEEQFQADDPRGYNELLDTFSLHQFIIRRGETLTSTPEFQSFKRKYGAVWGRVQDIVTLLERLLLRFSVGIAYIDGNRVVTLSEDDYRAPTIDDLLSCIVNLDQVLSVVQIPGRRFKGTDGRDNAVLALQACWRGHVVRKRCDNDQRLAAAAAVIQMFWRMVLFVRETKERVRLNKEADQVRFREMQDNLCHKWDTLSQKRRVVVHVPSLTREEAQRMSLSDFVLRQNGQLSRLTWIADPLVEVIVVSPFPLSPDVLQYYGKLLQIGGSEETEERYKIVHPENHARFPAHFSLATVLRHSPRCLKRIRNFLRGKEGYIVPGVVGMDDTKVALALNLPMLSPEPMVTSVYGSKSGAKRIFTSAEVNTPPSAFDLYDFNELCASLSSLIFQHLEIKAWLIKIDDEFGGRGHAVFPTTALQFYSSMVREREKSIQAWLDPARQEVAIKRIMQEVVKVLPTRLEIMRPDLFPDWEAFVETLSRVGCVVEAMPNGAYGSPSANVLVEPNGKVSLHSTHEQMWSKEFRYVGSLFPQTTCHHEALHQACLSVGRAAYDKRMFGYISVDFVSFADAQGLPRLWAVDLNPGLHDSAVSFELFNFIVGGEYETRDGHYYVGADDDNSTILTSPTPSLSDSVSVFALPADGRSSTQRRTYMTCDMLYHPNLASVQYNVFFNLCRLKGVHFDLQERLGTAFMLVDSFAGGTLGLMTVGKNPVPTLKSMMEALDFIQMQLGINKQQSEKYLPAGTFKDAVVEVKSELERRQNGDAKSKKKEGTGSKMVPF